MGKPINGAAGFLALVIAGTCTVAVLRLHGLKIFLPAKL